jgi:type IV secretion system protein VirD4
MVGFLGGVVIVTSIVMLIMGLRSARTPGRDDSASYHGSARFATENEESTLTFPISLERGEVPSPGCFILGPAKKKDHLVVLPLDLTRLHGLILGSTGTGKSRGFFMPNCAAVEDASIVVTDPKSELWKFTSGFHQRAMRYAPAEPDASLCFNWIPLCSDARMAELCARAIIESGNTASTDQFWIDAETAYLSAIFAHASTLDVPTPLTAYRLFTRQKPEHLLKQLQKSPSETAREQANIFSQTDARIKGAIVPAIAAKLQFLRDKEVARFTSASLKSPNFGEIRRQPTAVYWCLREQDITRLRPLTSLFFTVLLEHIAGEQIPEGAKGVPITMMMDEFANIGTIPDFATTLTLARGRGVAIWLGVQSLSQFEARYGRPNAQVIISNLSNKVALHGLDVTTAEYVSRMLGDTTVVAKRSNLALSTGGIGVVRQQTEHRRPLMTPDEIMLIGENEAIVRSGNRRPMILPKMWYDQEPKTARTTSLGQAQSMSFDAEANDEKSLPEIPQLPGPINTNSANMVEASAAATAEEEGDFNPTTDATNASGVILVDEMMLTDPYTK